MNAQPALRIVLSTRDGGARLTEQPAVRAGPATPPSLPRVSVDTSQAFQCHLGFGGAFTEAAAVTWLALGEAQRQQLLRDYFDPVHGHGYTLGRVHINSCDFSLGNYAHVQRPDDMALQSFSIERDRQALLPMIKAAQQVAGRPLQLLASPWSPPDWMKTNGRMNDGGRLRAECRTAWAQCFVRFIQAYADEGVPIWGVTVQNEPLAHQRWDSCLYSAEEERDFVRDHLGPALHAAGLSHVKLIVWDHNRDLMVERARVIYDDAEAARYVWGLGFHWYGPECFDHVQQVHDAWPDKQLLFTEGCQEGGPQLGSWEAAERYARNIIHDLNRWTVGWIDWNLLLDERGGPNHVGNHCHAPVMADARAGELMHQPSFLALGHFARHIQPQARRLRVDAPEGLLATAFRNPDRGIVVVVCHAGEQQTQIALSLEQQSWPVTLPPRSFLTLVHNTNTP